MSVTKAVSGGLNAFTWLLYAPFLAAPAFLLGWIGWDARIGGLAALAAGEVCLLASLYSALGAVAAMGLVPVPLLLSLAYIALPFNLPGPIDDAGVLTGGVLATVGLAVARWAGVNVMVPMALVFGAVYCLLPNLPGPVDDVLVQGMSVGAAALRAAGEGLMKAG